MAKNGKNGIIITRGDCMRGFEYSENKIIYLSVKIILPNPYQPRREYSREALEEMSQSIKQYGILQPVIVRLINNKVYELVSGERRLKAARLAGIETIPAVVIKGSDREAAAISIAENLQRVNLSYIEEAESIRILSEGFKYTYDEISHIINRSVKYIEETSEFLRLNKDIRTEMRDKNITRVQALAVLKIEEDSIKKKVIDKIAEYNLGDSAALELVENTIRQQKIKNETELKHIKMRSKFKDIRLFTSTLKQALSFIKNAGMETSYVISKNEDDYEINIKIKP